MFISFETVFRIAMTTLRRKFAILACLFALTGIVFAHGAPSLAAAPDVPAAMTALHDTHGSPAVNPPLQFNVCQQHSQCQVHQFATPAATTASTGVRIAVIPTDGEMRTGWHVLPLRRPPRA